MSGTRLEDVMDNVVLLAVAVAELPPLAVVLLAVAVAVASRSSRPKMPTTKLPTTKLRPSRPSECHPR